MNNLVNAFYLKFVSILRMSILAKKLEYEYGPIRSYAMCMPASGGFEEGKMGLP